MHFPVDASDFSEAESEVVTEGERVVCIRWNILNQYNNYDAKNGARSIYSSLLNSLIYRQSNFMVFYFGMRSFR